MASLGKSEAALRKLIFATSGKAEVWYNIRARGQPRMSTNENQIVVYQPNETVQLEVRFENETVCTLFSDIDWTKPISKIDAQLYEKYGLSASERQFIESMIKPME